MPLPIAHGLTGAAIVAALHSDLSFSRDWRYLLMGVFLGISPDFDYLLSEIKFLGRGWHHDFTHSILFSLILGVLASALLEKMRPGIAIKYGFAVLTHPLLDFVYTDSRGVELFWPFSNERFALGMMPPIEYAIRRDSTLFMAADLAGLCLVELFLSGAFLLAVLVLRRMFRLLGERGPVEAEKIETCETD